MSKLIDTASKEELLHLVKWMMKIASTFRLRFSSKDVHIELMVFREKKLLEEQSELLKRLKTVKSGSAEWFQAHDQFDTTQEQLSKTCEMRVKKEV